MKKIKLIVACAIGLMTSAEIAKAQECTMENAHGLYQDGEYKECVECLTKILQADSEDGHAYMLMGNVFGICGQMSQALEMYNLAEKFKDRIGSNKLIADLYCLRGSCYEDFGDDKKALENYQESLKYQKHTLAYKVMCEISLKTDATLPQAEKYADLGLKYAENVKDKSFAYNLKSMVAQKHHDLENARKFAEKAIELMPDESEFYIRLAEVAKESGYIELAAKSAINCLTHSGQDRAKTERAIAFLKETGKQNYEKIIEAIDSAGFNREYTLYLKSGVATESGHYEDALKSLEDWGLDEAYTCTRYADVCTAMGAFDVAAKYYDKLLENDPTSVSIMANLALQYESAGDEEQFFNIIERAIEQTPAYGFAYYRKGFHYYIHKQYGKAIEALEKAYMVDNEVIWAVLPLAQSYLKTGNTEKANELFRYMIEGKSEWDGMKENLAFAYFYLGDTENALKNAEELSAYDKACLHSLMGDKEKALKLYAEALDAGFNEFEHIKTDSDLDNIRDDARFVELTETYEKKCKERIRNYFTETH